MEIDPEVYARLSNHRWPGNVRELAHVLTVAAALSKGNRLEADLVASCVPGSSASPFVADERVSSLREQVTCFKKQLAHEAISSAAGNFRRAAESLGISLSTLYRIVS